MELTEEQKDSDGVLIIKSLDERYNASVDDVVGKG